MKMHAATHENICDILWDGESIRLDWIACYVKDYGAGLTFVENQWKRRTLMNTSGCYIQKYVVCYQNIYEIEIDFIL